MSPTLKFLFVLFITSYEVETVRARLLEEQKEFDYVQVLDCGELATAHSRSKRFVPWDKEPPTGKGISELGKDNIVGDESILENDANNIAFVFWKHHQTNVIFILTCQNANTTSLGKLSNKGCHSYSNFYRSKDLGGSFNRSDNLDLFKNYWLHSIYLSPANKEFIIITDYKNKTIFITNNEGADYEKVTVDFSPTFIEFHPTNKEAIAAFDNSKQGQQSLWLSQDRGKTWQFVSKNVKNYFWQNEHLADSSNGLYFERLEVNRNRIEGKLVSSLCHYPFPKGKAVQPVLEKITDLVQDSVYIGDEFVLVQLMTDMHLYSMRPKHDASFRKVVYKYKNSKPHIHHTVVTSDNNEIILAVFNPDKTVTLYLSDATGNFFFFIQENVIAEALTDAGKIPKIDFYRVKGFISSYIVNRKDNGTLISHDKGYSWNPLTYEVKGFGGKDIDTDCKKKGGKCRLNLFLKVEEHYSDYTAPLLSKDSAPGIILSQGRVDEENAKYEDIMNNEHQVYISTNGGRTWRQTLNSFYSYAILDHGNAIAATPLQFTVGQGIKLTTNFGYHWYEFYLTRRYSRIAAIITDSTAKTLVVNVFGFLYQQPHDSNVKGNQWVVWKFNFTKLIPRRCEDKDYYRYYPHRNKCNLGQKYSYLQNLRHENLTATCFSPPEYDLKPQRDSCSCTKADYECDDNFVSVPVGGFSYVCKSISNRLKQEQNCDQNGFYIKTKGYRKRHGNKCAGGVELELTGTKEKCDSALPVVKIRASQIAIGLNEPITFEIRYSTNSYGAIYSWDFGDGNLKSGTMSEVEMIKHSFKAIGHFTVKLVARNQKGSYTDSISIVVLDKSYHSAFIDFRPPIIVNEENKFKLQKLREDGESKEDVPHAKNIRFLWSFEGIYIGGTNYVEVSHKFSNTGVYQVEVQVISPVNAQAVYRVVRVYKKAYAINIFFSKYLDTLNINTQTWTNDFLRKFKRFIITRYNIDNRDERIIVQANNTVPTVVRIFICDVDSNLVSYKSAKELTKEIADDINKKTPLLDGYRTADIHLRSAEIIGPVKHTTTDGGDKSSSSNVWVYVVVMLVFILVIIAAIILYRNRGKKTWFNVRKNRNDNMQKKLVFHTDEDCVGLEGPDLPQYRD